MMEGSDKGGREFGGRMHVDEVNRLRNSYSYRLRVVLSILLKLPSDLMGAAK